MVTEVIGILETAAIAISSFLVKRCVFLEPDMETKKQRIFYAISFLLIAGVLFALGKDAASMTVMFLIGLNICLGRKTHRLRGLFLMMFFSNSGVMRIVADQENLQAADGEKVNKII